MFVTIMLFAIFWHFSFLGYLNVFQPIEMLRLRLSSSITVLKHHKKCMAVHGRTHGFIVFFFLLKLCNGTIRN